MGIIDRLHKLFSLLFIMKNFCDYLSVRWKIQKNGKVYFETKPDRLYIDINYTDIREKEVTEHLYVLSKLCHNRTIYTYGKEKNEIGICAFNKKTLLKFDLYSIVNIVPPAINAGVFIEEYDGDFFLVGIKDKLKFIIRKRNKSDILLLRDIFIYEEYDKYLPDLQGKIVLDVGGYIGDTAIYFSHLGASTVYVYEPHPILYKMMIKNIELNNIKNIKAINCGTSNENSIISIKERNSSDGPTAVFGLELPREREGRAVEVKVVSFKEIIDNIGEIDFMKMDCEGYESQALLSCDKVHLKKIKKMVVEYHADPEMIITHLEKNGFSVKVEKHLLIASLL
ncbi:MAG: FkbM family methyltransferase [Candidatus Brocadiales bacterium]|nr:FkbM family methyltransferase [Candidatus Brocadiales bacterium]